MKFKGDGPSKYSRVCFYRVFFSTKLSLQFKTAKWDELLSYWDKAVTEHPNDPDLLDMDGMTVTEVFEPYFRQMGLPVLKIKKNGLEYEIETDRFLFDEVKDKVSIII